MTSSREFWISNRGSLCTGGGVVETGFMLFNKEFSGEMLRGGALDEKMGFSEFGLRISGEVLVFCRDEFGG